MKKLLFLLILLFVIGCTGEDITSAVQDSQTIEINMIAKQWSFEPATITINEGYTVILHVESIDVAHSIAIPDFGVYENLIPGKTTTIQFVADKKGTFRFSCTVYCGSGHNSMTGQLIIN
jgi:cytochrome c oxidase subunit 2